MITRKQNIEKSDRFEIALIKMNKKSFSNSVSTLTKKCDYKHMANDVSYACTENGSQICYICRENYFCGQISHVHKGSTQRHEKIN